MKWFNTQVPLREYVESRFANVEALEQAKDLRDQQRFDAQGQALRDTLLAVDKATSAAFLAAEKATTKAEESAQKRFESVNEFRGQLNDQALTFIPRAEAMALMNSLSDKLEVAMRNIDLQLSELKESKALTIGGAAASRANFSYVIAAIGGFAGLIGIVAAVISLIPTH